MNKILPLPVKKNKFGQRVADVSVETYYRQIFEEVLEAHEVDNTDFVKDTLFKGTEGYFYQVRQEAEELIDVITCCVTRFAIVYSYDNNFTGYLQRLVTDVSDDYRMDDNFYTDLTQCVSYAYSAAKIADVVQFLNTEGCGQCAPDVEEDNYDEKRTLAYIIFICIRRLEYLGYDEVKRQELYAKVNEKNRKRGYFDD